MYTRTVGPLALLCSFAAAAPAPKGGSTLPILSVFSAAESTFSQLAVYDSSESYADGAANVVATDQSGSVSGYTDADAPFASYTPRPVTVVPSSFGHDSMISAIHTDAPTSGWLAADTQRSPHPTGPTTHGPYDGTPTVTGAVSTTALAKTISPLPLAPYATYYNTNGKLQHDEPIPYEPAGGAGTNGTLPRYMVESDFDYESVALGLYQEWIELDCFNNGLATFSNEDFLEAGLTSEDIELIRFMGQQEQGHATLLSNMLGETAPPQCTYNYPYTNVREFVDFNQILTRFGESGMSSFLRHFLFPKNRETWSDSWL